MPDEAAGEEPGQADEVPWGVSVLDAFTVFPEAFSSHPSCPLLLLGAQDCGTFLIVLRFLFMHVSSGTSCFGGDLLSKSEKDEHHLPCGEARVDLPSGCCWGTNKARPRGRHLPA